MTKLILMFQHKKERACVSSQELWRGYCNWTHSPLYFNAQDAPGWGERQAEGRQGVSELRPLVNLDPGPSFPAEPVERATGKTSSRSGASGTQRSHSPLTEQNPGEVAETPGKERSDGASSQMGLARLRPLRDTEFVR